MDDTQAPANSMMKSAAPLKMDDDIIEIEEEGNTLTNSSPRRTCLTPDWQAPADSMMELITGSVSKLRPGDPPTIYKVPQTIRQVNKVAYEPEIVSIGPYHKGKEKLQAMEEHKRLYLHSFLSRNTKYKLEHYLKAMSEWEDEARSCYYDNVDLHLQVGNEFVKMMVLDACFIVELFLRFHPMLLRQQWEKLKQNEEDLGLLSAMKKFSLHSNGLKDPILDSIRVEVLIRYDMLLLENQIPFFVLQRIFKMACPLHESHLLAEMALQYFFFQIPMPRNEKIENKDSYYHLLHLFHSHLIPTPNDSEEELNGLCNHLVLISLPCSKETSLPITEPPEMIPCATDLELAGVKFKKSKKSNNILNVKFSNGVLEITPFKIHYHSEILFRNLVAFEQCYPKATIDFFTTYFVFMDYLVNTSKDVALLHQNGIIDNLLRSDEDVARLFNQLCIGIFHEFEGSYLEDVKGNVQKHCKNKWNMWRASLKRDYFTNPWSVISLIAASILLLLTITQTFFSVFPYYRPRS